MPGGDGGQYNIENPQRLCTVIHGFELIQKLCRCPAILSVGTEVPLITDRQVGLLRQKRMEGKTQETAAAKAGMSVRSARKWQSGPLPSQAKPEHRWRTRPDPFDGVWEDEIEPLLRNDPAGKLKAHCLNKTVTQRDWLPQIK